MTKRQPVLLGLLAVPLVLATGATAQDGKQTAKLSYKAFQKWSFITPQQAWTPVTGDGIQVKHPNGDFFAAEKDGQKLSVDTTANGKLNKDVKGAGGYLVLRSKGEDGNVFNYAVRLQGSSGGYKYASSGVMFGTVGGVPVQLSQYPVSSVVPNNSYWEVSPDGGGTVNAANHPEGGLQVQIRLKVR